MFSARWRSAMRTRFSCCLMFGIRKRAPQKTGGRMVATGALPMLTSVSEDAEHKADGAAVGVGARPSPGAAAGARGPGVSPVFFAGFTGLSRVVGLVRESVVR